MSSMVVPFSLQSAPSLIEKLLPVQKLSVDIFRERTSVQSQTLTSLGSYWKGRKPLVLNRACVLAALLPATGNDKRDLEIFEMLMSMDDVSISKRHGLPSPSKVIAELTISDVWRFFKTSPEKAQQLLPKDAPFDVTQYPYVDVKGQKRVVKLMWRDDVSNDLRHKMCLPLLPQRTYRQVADQDLRAEDILDTVTTHIWNDVNAHLGTSAYSFAELVEQLGIMRWGRRPRVGDTFSGSGQIPFEAARLGCDVYASDLNPISCLLSWGAFNIVGGSQQDRGAIRQEQLEIVNRVRAEIDSIKVETDGAGWRAKLYLYCLEVLCPTSGWRVPMLKSRLVSLGRRSVVKLIPNYAAKSYDIVVCNNVSDEELADAENGTIAKDASKYDEATVVHYINGVEHRNKISSIRGDYTVIEDGKRLTRNRLRPLGASELTYRSDDIYNERLYAIQWVKDDESVRPQAEFRSVTQDDVDREKTVLNYVNAHFEDWQANGWVPDMRIEVGGPPRYAGRSLVDGRGWTYWHHAFSPRQIMFLALCKKAIASARHADIHYVFFARLIDWSSKLCRYGTGAARESVAQTFYNQALNELYNYGVRPFNFAQNYFTEAPATIGLSSERMIEPLQASKTTRMVDIWCTDPPYGNAVRYEEILDFFVAWLRRNPPKTFADWVWDSRRALAIKGEDHDFKVSMVDAYRNMTTHMSDDGLQIIMFTHQDNAIWADMANIVWASGLRVTAAWYVVTETDSALRDGQYVKGTILLVLRKRTSSDATYRDEIAYELEDEVRRQVEMLAGLNVEAKDLYHGQNLFEDADLQMAGYAAALRVLTRYAEIDGIQMAQEAMRPRIKGQRTMVDELIEFAVTKANEFLVPQGIDKATWTKLNGSERFYLKIVEAEAGGAVTKAACDNYAKAFKVRDYGDLFEQVKANNVRAKSARTFGKRSLSSNDEFGASLVRAVLYGTYLLGDGTTNSEDVLAQLRQLIPNYFDRRDQLKVLAQFLHRMTSKTRPEESIRAMVLRDLVHNERV